jgi:uncharacterized protein YndB with AHSA1/START domain
MTAKNETKPSSDRELVLVITRIIDASRELVFKAWTEHLPEWGGRTA